MATVDGSGTAKSESCQSPVFSVSFNNAWKPSTENELKANLQSKNPATTYRLQIHGDSITATADATDARSNIGLGKNPASVARRNARERRRIKNVNSAFDELRQHVPNGERNRKKISKVDTLQSAIEYIKALEELVRSRRSNANIDNVGNKENAPTSLQVNPASPMELSDSTSNEANFEHDDVIFVKQTLGAEESGNDVVKRKKEKDGLSSSDSKENSKPQRPAEITESMLKAFDVMLEKCSNSRKTASSSLGESATLNNLQTQDKLSSKNSVENFQRNQKVNENVDTTSCDIQSQASDSGFSELFGDAADQDNSDFNAFDFNADTSQRIRQSSLDNCSGDFEQNSGLFEYAASPILSENSSTIFDSQTFCRDPELNQRQNYVNPGPIYAQLSVKSPVQEESSHPNQVMRDIAWLNGNQMNNFNGASAAHNDFQGNTFWQNLIPSGGISSRDIVESRDFQSMQNFDQPMFDSQSQSVATAIDQINPTINFLPGQNLQFHQNFSQFLPSMSADDDASQRNLWLQADANQNNVVYSGVESLNAM